MTNIDLTQLITTGDKLAEARANRYANLARLRWQYETGGVTLPDGTSIATTRESQAQITSVAQSVNAGLITGPVDWKMVDGWQDLPPEQILLIAQVVTDHVKHCFAAERAVSEQMDAISGDLQGFDIQAAFDAACSAPSK